MVVREAVAPGTAAPVPAGALRDAADTAIPAGCVALAPRKDFPVFDGTTRSGKPLVFLDSAASSPKPRAVIEAMAETYAHHYANVHRGIYELSEDATARFEGARRRIARFIGAASEREIVFVRNATEAINLVAYSWGRANVSEGDRIVCTELEHHANIVPWQQLAAETGARVEYAHITDDGLIDLDDLGRKLRGESAGGRSARLLAVSHVSNALGTISPVREMVAMAHDAGALCLVDGAQAVPHVPVDVRKIGCDFLAFSGHKMLGPSGIGVLWGRRELLDAMPPFMTGGSMITRVTLDGATWNEVPWKFEAGTPAIVEAIGLGVAVDYLAELGMDAIRQHERALFRYAWEQLGCVPGLRRLGPADPELHAGVISFVLDGVHPHDVATVLDAEGVAVRAGHHCAQPVMLRYDLPATTRASFYVYNDATDLTRLTDALRSAQQVFGV